MRITSRTFSAAVLVAICIAANPVPATGQSVWLPLNEEPTLSLEVLKTDFWHPPDEGPKFSATVWFLSARIPASDHVVVLAELPFVHYDQEPTCGGYPPYPCYEFEAEDMVGNPYIGLEVRRPGAAFYGQFGIRPALAPDDKKSATLYGGITDVDRVQAFLPDQVALNCRLGWSVQEWPDVIINLYTGPSFFLPMEGEDRETYIDYGAQLWVQSGVARVGGGLTGRLWATAEEGNVWEITEHQFGFAANFGSGKYQPGVHLRVPLDDDWEQTPTKYVYGVSFTVKLGASD